MEVELKEVVSHLAWVLATEEGQDLEKVNNKRKTLGDVLELGLFLRFLLDSWAP